MQIERRAILEIAKTLVGSILQKKDLHQQLLQKFSEILHVGRCVLFQVNDCGGGTHTVEIIAGIPSGEHEHGIGLKGPISQYPDIEAAVKQGKVKVITDPEKSPLTDHFRKIIEQKEIRQILYLPLISMSEKTIGVIVVDAAGKKTEFEPEEIDFCGEVGELITIILDQEEVLIQKMRDLFINRIVPLGGFAKRLVKLVKEFEKDACIIVDEVKKVEDLCLKNSRINF